MKRIFIVGLFALILSVPALSQVQASIGAGSGSTRIKLYIRPVTAVNGTISTLAFSVAVPATTTPVPTLTLVSAAVGSGWQIDPPYLEGTFYNYSITTTSSPNVNIAAGAETEVMELQFAGGPSTASSVSLLTLPFGGSENGNALFFCSGAGTSVEGQLYYNRGGGAIVNNLSYSGGPASSATLGGVILPVNWLSFDAVKQGNDGLLTWKVANEEFNHHYELQRSIDGSSYVNVATVNKIGTGNGTRDYQYTDPGITTLGVPVVYYRIKQVDMDGKSSISPFRIIRLTLKKGPISVYPNPATEGFYVVVPFEKPDNKIVKLNLLSGVGQLVQSKEITALQATNYYFDIKGITLSTGQYQLQIIHEGQVLETKKIFINRK